MANFATSKDIIEWALFMGGEPTNGTSDFDPQMVEWLNRAYRSIWSAGGEFAPELEEDWWWLRAASPGIITIQPQISAGTVAVTNNNAAITFSSGPAPELDGGTTDPRWYFKVTDHADVFRIATHTAAGTAATLDGIYTGPTNSAASFKLFQLEYNLPTNTLRLVSPIRAYQDVRYQIFKVDAQNLDRHWPLKEIHTGVPEEFAMIGNDRLRFNRAGFNDATKFIRTDFDYLIEPIDLADDTVEPLIPIEYRHILADATLFFLYAVKEDSRTAGVAEGVRRSMISMSLDNRHQLGASSRDLGRIITRQDDLTIFRRPLRTESGHIIG